MTKPKLSQKPRNKAAKPKRAGVSKALATVPPAQPQPLPSDDMDDGVLRVRLPGTPYRRHPRTPANSQNKQAMAIVGAHGESDDETRARLVLSPAYVNALTAKNFAQGGIFDGSQTQLDITACTQEVVDKMAAIEGGDTREIERQLLSQAIALQAVFGEMSRRAAMNMGQYIEPMEIYMRLALKAQSQARATLETLAEIKNPRPIFINGKQVNVANGSQQVNNADGPQQVNNEAGAAPSASRTPENKEPANKLLEQ